METMPIGATIAYAYGFLIRRFFHILGLIWLPAAIYAVGAVLSAPVFFAGAARIAEAGFGFSLWRDEIEMVALFVAGLALFSVIAVSLSRLALDLEQNRFLAHFTFGSREARLFLASLRLVLLLVGTVVAVLVLAYAVAWALGAFDVVMIPLDERGLPSIAAMRESPTLGWAVIGAELIALAAAVFAGLRFGFLLAPIAACEDHARLRHAWELSAGQFWRMLLVTLAVVVPVWLVMMLALYFTLRADLMAFYMFGVPPEQRAQAFADMAAAVAGHAPLFAALKGAGLFLFSSLFFGAAGFAYRKPAAPAREKPAMAEHIPPMTAPVAVAAAAAATVASEPSIEHSLLDQFGAHVHEPQHDAHGLPPAETHVASVSSEQHAQAGAAHDDILDLEPHHEIHDAPLHATAVSNANGAGAASEREEHARETHAPHV